MEKIPSFNEPQKAAIPVWQLRCEAGAGLQEPTLHPFNLARARLVVGASG